MTIRRAIASVVLFATSVLSTGAAQAQGRSWASEQPLGDAELASQRGGFTIAGLDVQFGAEIQSYLGDQLVMQTNVSWTDVGGNVANNYSASLTPATADSVRAGLLTGTGVKLSLSTGTVLLANQGQTAFIQRTTGTIQNIIINTASNVKLDQIVDAKLDISGYSLFRTGVISTRIGSTLAAMGALASLSNRPN